MTKIINWETKETIIEDNYSTIEELVGKAVKENISLAKADLSGADLKDAFLEEADLRNANLKGAELYEAFLKGAYLESNDIGGNERLEGLLKALGFNII